LDFDSFYDELYSGDHGQIVSSGWCADYPDPENFAELFHSASIQNQGNYSSPDVDALLEEARTEPDTGLRLRLYQQVQQMLIDDSAAIFLSHSEAYYLVTKPYLQGYIAAPINVPQHMNLRFEYDN
jgi:oligopeptide transport system substrate-binding protein